MVGWGGGSIDCSTTCLFVSMGQYVWFFEFVGRQTLFKLLLLFIQLNIRYLYQNIKGLIPGKSIQVKSNCLDGVPINIWATIIIMRSQYQRTTNSSLNSESSSSSEESEDNEQELRQNRSSVRTNQPAVRNNRSSGRKNKTGINKNIKHKGKSSNGLKMFGLILIAATLLILTLFRQNGTKQPPLQAQSVKSQPSKQSSSTISNNMDNLIDSQTRQPPQRAEAMRPTQPTLPTQAKQSVQPAKATQKAQPTQQIKTKQTEESSSDIFFSLKNKTQTQQITNSFFLKQKLSKGMNHWLTKRDVVCISDRVVNSASKIDINSFAQKTAYEQITLITPSVKIPAQNIYALQPPRQFIQNISKLYPNKILAYDYEDPLLLVLVAHYFSTGLLVTDKYNWPLFQKNLILNDLFLLAQRIQHKALMNSNKYQILICADIQQAVSLIVNQKKQMIALIRLNAPSKIETAFLLKMKLYKLEEGIQCQNRIMTIFEQSRWRLQDEVFLQVGWYVFTNEYNDINLKATLKNYENPLRKYGDHLCLTDSQYVYNPYALNNKFYLINLPYQQLFLYSFGIPQIKNHYRGVYTYLQANKPLGTIFLQSGSSHLLLIVVAAISPNSTILLEANYEQKRMFYKNLAINNQQKVEIKNTVQLKDEVYDLVITKNHSIIQKYEAYHFIFENNNEIEKYQGYEYRQIIQNQCSEPKLKMVEGKYLSKGLFLIKKN